MAIDAKTCPMNSVTMDTEEPIPGQSNPQPIGEKPALDPSGPGYGTTPEENPQMEPVEGKENIYKSPEGQYYEYREDTDQKWYPAPGLPNAVWNTPQPAPAPA